MPAVTVPDITILPRVDANPTTDTSRPRTVKQVTTAPQGFEGEGFPVRRAFAGIDLAELRRSGAPAGRRRPTALRHRRSDHAA